MEDHSIKEAESGTKEDISPSKVARYWTKAETDMLVELAQEYEERIHPSTRHPSADKTRQAQAPTTLATFSGANLI